MKKIFNHPFINMIQWQLGERKWRSIGLLTVYNLGRERRFLHKSNKTENWQMLWNIQIHNNGVRENNDHFLLGGSIFTGEVLASENSVFILWVNCKLLRKSVSDFFFPFCMEPLDLEQMLLFGQLSCALTTWVRITHLPVWAQFIRHF